MANWLIDIGFSLQEVRIALAISVSTLGAPLVIDYFGRKLRKPRR
jgi:hypothetical protein